MSGDGGVGDSKFTFSLSSTGASDTGKEGVEKRRSTVYFENKVSV
jgi:hypothetical protein